MYRVGVITSDKEFLFYQTINNRGQEILFVHLKKEEDFDIIDKLVIPHQEAVVLDLLLERLRIMSGLEKWLNNNKPICCFGLSTYYIFQKITYCPVKIRMNKYISNYIQLEKILFYPSIEEYTCISIPSLTIEEVGEESEVLSKNKKHIIAFKYKESIGCLFIPDKELECLILNQYVNINSYV